MKIVLDEIFISNRILATLPRASNIGNIYDGVLDMDGNAHRAMKVLWTDSLGTLRKAFLRVDNGAYIGEA